MLKGAVITIAVITGLIPFLLVILPDIEMPDTMKTGIEWFFDVLWKWDFIIPVDTMLYCFSIYIGFQIIGIILSIGMFVFKTITRTTS